MTDDKHDAQSQLDHLQYEDNTWNIYYQDVVTLTMERSTGGAGEDPKYLHLP
jgi:hypothetical protein